MVFWDLCTPAAHALTLARLRTVRPHALHSTSAACQHTAPHTPPHRSTLRAPAYHRCTPHLHGATHATICPTTAPSPHTRAHGLHTYAHTPTTHTAWPHTAHYHARTAHTCLGHLHRLAEPGTLAAHGLDTHHHHLHTFCTPPTLHTLLPFPTRTRILLPATHHTTHLPLPTPALPPFTARTPTALPYHWPLAVLPHLPTASFTTAFCLPSPPHATFAWPAHLPPTTHCPPLPYTTCTALHCPHPHPTHTACITPFLLPHTHTTLHTHLHTHTATLVGHCHATHTHPHHPYHTHTLPSHLYTHLHTPPHTHTHTFPTPHHTHTTHLPPHASYTPYHTHIATHLHTHACTHTHTLHHTHTTHTHSAARLYRTRLPCHTAQFLYGTRGPSTTAVHGTFFGSPPLLLHACAYTYRPLRLLQHRTAHAARLPATTLHQACPR